MYYILSIGIIVDPLKLQFILLCILLWVYNCQLRLPFYFAIYYILSIDEIAKLTLQCPRTLFEFLVFFRFFRKIFFRKMLINQWCFRADIAKLRPVGRGRMWSSEEFVRSPCQFFINYTVIYAQLCKQKIDIILTHFEEKFYKIMKFNLSYKSAPEAPNNNNYNSNNNNN